MVPVHGLGTHYPNNIGVQLARMGAMAGNSVTTPELLLNQRRFQRLNPVSASGPEATVGHIPWCPHSGQGESALTHFFTQLLSDHRAQRCVADHGGHEENVPGFQE